MTSLPVPDAENHPHSMMLPPLGLFALTILPSHRRSQSHEGSQIPCDRLVTVIRLLQALMLLMVISSLPNVLTAWYSALYCPYHHSDINTNVVENLIKHFMRAMCSCCATFL
jgi:hypothetical protein